MRVLKFLPCLKAEVVDTYMRDAQTAFAPEPEQNLLTHFSASDPLRPWRYYLLTFQNVGL